MRSFFLLYCTAVHRYLTFRISAWYTLASSRLDHSRGPEIKEKFLCQSKFAQDIEYLVATSKINYIEAIVTYCEENGIEFESVSKLISKPLKEKLKCEATQLNFLKKTSRAKLMF